MKRKSSLFSQRPKSKSGNKSSTVYPSSITVERLSHEGRGVAKVEGKTLFIEGALPGEEVAFSVSSKHRRYDEAICTEVISPSPQRAEPKCPHYNRCGGCDLQHLAHEHQIETKQYLVLDQLRRLGNLEPHLVCEPLVSPAWEYRRNCRIGINQLSKDGSAIVGFRRRGSNKLTAIDHCPVLADPLNQILGALPGILESTESFKNITHAELSLADNQGALTLRVTKPLTSDLEDAFLELATKNNFCLFLDNGKDIKPVSKDSDLYYNVSCSNSKINFKPGDFIQVNSSINEQMIKRALEWLNLNSSDRVLDLFSGIGNFTLPVATLADSVVGVEGVDDMVTRASQNASENNLDNCYFYRADLSKDLTALPWYKQGFNKIILDPPRTGALEVIKQLDKHQPETILYISCNPAALARDGAELVNQGYSAERFCVMDMFPHTSHVESMMLFTKNHA